MVSITKQKKSMTENRIWTIKGIEVETRLAVQKAAKKEGMSMGKYCNLKLREAAIQSLKTGDQLTVQSENMTEELKIQINVLKEELPDIIKRTLEEIKSKQTGLLRRLLKK